MPVPEIWEVEARALWIEAAYAKDFDTVAMCECALHGIVSYTVWTSMTNAGRETMRRTTQEGAQTAVKTRLAETAIAVGRVQTSPMEQVALDDLVRRSR